MSTERPHASQASGHIRPPEIWTLTLNRYQRDNLLWLLNRVGYPWDNPHRVANLGDLAWAPTSLLPQGLLGDGDWLGEIVHMLAKVERWDNGKPVVVTVIDGNDRPNGHTHTEPVSTESNDSGGAE